MGAFPDDIRHFYPMVEGASGDSGRGRIHELSPDAFIPRLVFGDYLQDLLFRELTAR